ncbi:MAG: hypothetical protein ACQR33_02195 [Candidatus Saccharibacteria bacterium]
MYYPIVFVFFTTVACCVAILLLFQLGVARKRFRQRKFGTVIVMYAAPILALFVFWLTQLAKFDGPLLWASSLMKWPFSIGWVPEPFQYFLRFVVPILVFVLLMGAGIAYALIWSSSMEFWPKVASILLYIFYGWFAAACVVGVNAGMVVHR